VQIAKWGNSFAVRIPADIMRSLGLKEGDEIELRTLDDGAVAIISAQQLRDAMIARMGELARPLPPGYKFDREEANAR
jgi:antitoxin MazE